MIYLFKYPSALFIPEIQPINDKKVTANKMSQHENGGGKKVRPELQGMIMIENVEPNKFFLSLEK